MRCFLMLFLQFFAASTLYNLSVAQDSIPEKNCLYGDYIDSDNNLIKIAIPEDDTSHLEVSYKKKHYLFDCISDTLFQTDSADMQLFYYLDSLVIDNVIYYRLTGRNEFNKVVFKNKFKKAENKLYLDRKKEFLERGGCRITHFKNNIKNGKYVVRKGLYKIIRGNYKNGLQDGKWVYNHGRRTGKIWYKEGKEIKGKNVKTKHIKLPKNYNVKLLNAKTSIFLHMVSHQY